MTDLASITASVAVLLIRPTATPGDGPSKPRWFVGQVQTLGRGELEVLFRTATGTPPETCAWRFDLQAALEFWRETGESDVDDSYAPMLAFIEFEEAVDGVDWNSVPVAEDGVRRLPR